MMRPGYRREAHALRALLMLLTIVLGTSAPTAAAATVNVPTLQEILDLLPLGLLPPIVPLVIPDTTVGPGAPRTYEDRDYTVEGTITVEDGGVLIMEDASFEVAQTSGGIVVEPGGTFRMTNAVFASTLGANTQPTAFAIDLQEGAHVEITGSTVRGGAGVRLATDDATIWGVVFERNSVGLSMVDVTITLADNLFLANEVGINQTGGQSRITRNTFIDGTYGMRDWRTDPVIDNNTFDGPHYGIWHEQSATIFEFNDIKDRLDPGGVGIGLVGQMDLGQLQTNSVTPTIVRNNTIGRFGTGILVQSASATITDNVVNESVLDGILVENNTGQTRIERNVIHHNAGNGIRVWGTNVPVHNNTIHNNSADGVILHGVSGGDLADNLIENNTAAGVRVLAHDNATIARNTLRANGIGIRIEATAPDALVLDAKVYDSVGAGIDARGARTNVTRANVSGSGDAGVAVRGPQVKVWNGALLGNAIGLEADGASGLAVAGTSIRASAGDGVYYHDSNDATFDHVNASANGADGFHVVAGSGDVVSLTCARAIANDAHGLDADGASGISATSGWFQDNAGFGALWTGAGTLSATSSYWGATNGPTHASNPGGTGDNVSNGVTYTPFLVAPPTC